MKVENNMVDSFGRKSRGRPRSWHVKAEQNTIKALDRGLEVLEKLSETQSITLSALATQVDQSVATVYRILYTFEERGFVEFDAKLQVWSIGSKSFMVGNRFLKRTNLFDNARQILRNLMEKSGETANLGIESGGMVLCVSQVETEERIRAYFPQGSLSPMHASGIGKVLLAHMNRNRFRRWMKENKLDSFTEKTFSNSENLQTELQAIRSLGFAIDDEESNLGMRCFAAPVYDLNEEVVAGISVSGPTSRVLKDSSLSLLVMDSAKELSEAIGGRVPALKSKDSEMGR